MKGLEVMAQVSAVLHTDIGYWVHHYNAQVEMGVLSMAFGTSRTFPSLRNLVKHRFIHYEQFLRTYGSEAQFQRLLRDRWGPGGEEPHDHEPITERKIENLDELRALWGPDAPERPYHPGILRFPKE